MVSPETPKLHLKVLSSIHCRESPCAWQHLRIMYSSSTGKSLVLALSRFIVQPLVLRRNNVRIGDGVVLLIGSAVVMIGLGRDVGVMANVERMLPVHS